LTSPKRVLEAWWSTTTVRAAPWKASTRVAQAVEGAGVEAEEQVGVERHLVGATSWSRPARNW
jgi:hypothetical protein